MKDPKSASFSVRLKEAERSGIGKVMDLCAEEMRKYDSDGEKLAELADCVGRNALDAYDQNNDELASVYQCAFYEISAFAAAYLSQKEYHRYCVKLSWDCWGRLE